MLLVWGAKNYSRSDVMVRRGTCDACGYAGRFQDYNASRFGHLYYIPLIPLGRKRVLSECPNCRGGRVLPYRHWEDLVQNQWRQRIQAFRADSNRENAIAALAESSVFATDLELSALFERVIQEHAEDAEVMCLLGVMAYQRCRNQVALEALSAALMMDETHETRAVLAEVLMATHELDEAQMHTNQLVEAGHPAGASVLWQLASVYQKHARHSEALACFDRFEQVYPSQVQQIKKHLRKLRQKSEKAIRKGRGR